MWSLRYGHLFWCVRPLMGICGFQIWDAYSVPMGLHSGFRALDDNLYIGPKRPGKHKKPKHKGFQNPAPIIGPEIGALVQGAYSRSQKVGTPNQQERQHKSSCFHVPPFGIPVSTACLDAQGECRVDS